MKRIYSRFRIALMTFTLGLATVYFVSGLSIASREIPMELPAVQSANVLLVFPDNRAVLTREINCGKYPRDAQARMDCTNERLFGNRDMSLYTPYEITSCLSDSGHDRYDCGIRTDSERKQRHLIWRHWRDKTRAHIVFKYFDSSSEDHYFVEPDDNGRWQLVNRRVFFRYLFVGDGRANVGIVDNHTRAYQRARWKIATEDDEIYHLFPRGTRYLEFENERGTVSF